MKTVRRRETGPKPCLFLAIQALIQPPIQIRRLDQVSDRTTRFLLPAVNPCDGPQLFFSQFTANKALEIVLFNHAVPSLLFRRPSGKINDKRAF